MYFILPSSFLSCILLFFLVCVLFILFMLRELDDSLHLWNFPFVLFFFCLFVLSIFSPRTHPKYPTQRVPQLVTVLLLPFTKPHWNERLNPTDVSERPRSKPERGGGGGSIFIQGLLPESLLSCHPASLPGCAVLWGLPNRSPATRAWYLKQTKEQTIFRQEHKSNHF